MNRLDTLYEITSYLPDSTLLDLYLLGLVPCLFSLSRNQLWWYNRCLALSGVHIPWKSGDWKETYLILTRELERDIPSIWNREDNSMAAHILIKMGYIVTQEHIREAALHNSLDLFILFCKSSPWSQSLLVSCIHIAVEYGHYLILEYIFKHCTIKLNQRDVVLMSRACSSRWGNETGNYTKTVELLIGELTLFPTSLSQEVEYALDYSDNVEIVKLIIKKHREGGDLVRSNRSLEKAIEMKRYEAARLFIRAGMCPVKVLKVGVLSGVDAVQFLIEQIGDQEIDERTATKSLEAAVELGDVLSVDLLLARKEVRAIVDEDTIFCARVALRYDQGIVELLEATLSGDLG